MQEKRKYQRVTVILNASYLNTMVDVLDLSEEGMRIKAKVKIPYTEDISFYIFLSDMEMVKVTGSIAWEDVDDKAENIYGIKFDINSESDKKSLTSFLEQARKGSDKDP